ncbi:hypothetical protein DL766_009855 [Monosporascus sp. MC13-8B]|uniref:Uncharacterized protein n=1 Tax=Monosporascus cannonballus TaxID=155416 RepID=A0ABY0GW54_9PEZI|nr:hypothetical protein DL762_008787 [Monosporascus cannonballus]RYO83063.1 hypothetical protein DL763_008012 [Monosporascus cannonballus]RYP13441.1 hypothetical protein DL766_009855 [Monosporascus sp. MC13-8B]
MEDGVSAHGAKQGAVVPGRTNDRILGRRATDGPGLAVGLGGVPPARSILYDELLLGAADLALMESWKLRDDLDTDDFDGSWLTDARNAALLDGSEHA